MSTESIKNDKPLVTIIITTCKRPPELLIRAIKSALGQTYDKIEILVVDDSPADCIYRDQIRDYIRNLNDSRVSLIQHKTNLGACFGRNTAIALSTGEFIIYLDDDDEFLPECVEKKLSGFTSDDIGLVYSKRYLVKDDDPGFKNVPDQLMVKGDIFKYTIKKNNIAAFPMIRRECIVNCGGFDTQMKSAQDYEMWLRILLRYKANYIDEPLALVHLHDQGRITSTPTKAIQGTKRICKIYRSYYLLHPWAYHNRMLELCKLYLNYDKKAIAFLYLSSAILLNVFDFSENAKHCYMFFRKAIKK